MKRQRALAPALVAFAALVGVGALCAILLGSAGGAAVSSESDVSAQAPLRLVLSATQDGSLIFSWDPDKDGAEEAHVLAYARDGSLLWDMAGIETGIEAGLPSAVLVKAAPTQESGQPGALSVLRVGVGGVQELARSEGAVRLLRADSSEAVYVETLWNELGVPHSTIVTIGQNGRQDTDVPGDGQTEGIGISADGLVLALVTKNEEGNRLAWFERDSGEPWRLVSNAPTPAYYVSLSADGRKAVLGPEVPVLTERSLGESVELPVDYVAEARFGTSRLLLIDFRVVANATRTIVQTVGLGSNAVEWSREFAGEQRVASDKTISQLAYVQAGKRGVVVVDLSGGTERIYPVEPADDLAFLDSKTLLVVLQDGSVTSLEIGEGQ
jgi:hypothetical protein